MRVVSPELVSGKKVLLRLDLDVPLVKGKIIDDFRLKAGLPTLKLCLEHAKEVIIMGHLGRPEGKEVLELSVASIAEWLEREVGQTEKLKILENLRFEAGEEDCDSEYAQSLAALGDFFVNEAFASYHPAASTTILPTLLPHAAGLHFAREVEVLTNVRENPKRPLVAVLGGAKIEDKLSMIRVMCQLADAVLVGGKMVAQMRQKPGILKEFEEKLVLGELTKDGLDLTPETLQVWRAILNHHTKTVIWNGPIGKIENSKFEIRNSKLSQEDLGSARGTYELAEAIAESGAETIVGGGDTVGFLQKIGMVDKFNFVSTGGGAMLKFLINGSLPTIDVLT